MFVFLTPIRYHEGNGTQASLRFGVAHRDTLKYKCTALPSIKHGGNAFQIY